MTKRRGLGVGSISLILIFSVLCLVIFTLLTLSTARSNAALAEKAAQSAREYYTADTEAQYIISGLTAALKAGDRPEEIRGTPVSYDESGADFTLPIGSSKSLAVTVDFSGSITQYKEISGEDWSPDEHINVYK